MPPTGGATHRYINSSPECWSLYGEVLAVEYQDMLLMRRAHQLTVDAYAAHHPGGSHPDKSIAIHLVGLHLALERGTAHTALPQVRKALADAAPNWPHLKPPTDRGDITVFDVAKTSSSAEHIRGGSPLGNLRMECLVAPSHRGSIIAGLHVAEAEATNRRSNRKRP